MVKTVFLDRDGVINEKQPEGRYVTAWAEFVFLPGVIEACRLLTDSGLRVIIATNQRGVARGLMSHEDLDNIHRSMVSELSKHGAVIDAIYVCPHEKNECECRKPETGLFLRARKDFGDIDFHRSVVIGDSLSDMIAGSRLGIKTLLVADGDRKTAILTEADESGLHIDGVYPSLYDAVISLLSN